MLDRILSATPKQWAVMLFVGGICIGSFFAAVFFQELPRDRSPNGLTIAAVALIFVGTASIGFLPGCVLLIIHYLTRGNPEESQLASPWASKKVKGIIRNLSEEEKRRYRRHAAGCGAWVGMVAGALVISLGLLFHEFSVFAAVRAAISLLLYLAVVYWMTRRTKRFLASTEYAKRNGIEAAQIGLQFCRRG